VRSQRIPGGLTRLSTGYCPQFDALLDLLTVREHLELYGRLKGVPLGAELDSAVSRMLSQLRLGDYASRLAYTLSGGNKRKLSVAVALMGQPQILILDEPTTGLDVVNRRFLLDVVAEYARAHAVILTTHSMEEVEALCTRVGIMVSGELRCFGPVQHLKNRFGRGVLLRARVAAPGEREVALLAGRLRGEAIADQASLARACTSAGDAGRQARVQLQDATGWILRSALDRDGRVEPEAFAAWWLGEDAFERLDAFVRRSLPGAALVERRGADAAYRVLELGLKLGAVFALVEANKMALGVQEYSVSGTSLEQIFLSFAQTQTEEAAEVRGVAANLAGAGGLVA
jgi:ATP-binding cassette subfamily A (ABC1) protein 3